MTTQQRLRVEKKFTPDMYSTGFLIKVMKPVNCGIALMPGLVP